MSATRLHLVFPLVFQSAVAVALPAWALVGCRHHHADARPPTLYAEPPAGNPYQNLAASPTASPGLCKFGDFLDCRGQCEGNHHAQSCRSLGYMHQTGSGAPIDTAQAMALYEKSCELGWAGGCTDVGFLFHRGVGRPIDESQALRWFHRGCEEGDATGCFDLGTMYQAGAAVPREDGRAAALFERACVMGSANGCGEAGASYLEGRGVKTDRAKGVLLFQRACALCDVARC
ncbi:MAG: hypothetical protein NVSMB1_04650 [Polyangiales bacterium]